MNYRAPALIQDVHDKQGVVRSPTLKPHVQQHDIRQLPPLTKARVQHHAKDLAHDRPHKKATAKTQFKRLPFFSQAGGHTTPVCMDSTVGGRHIKHIMP